MNIFRKRAVVVTTVIVLLLVPAVTWTQRWEIFDWWRLRAYEAPSEIAVLADRTTMTDYARKLLYVYHAELQDKEGFNQHCQNAEHTIVLGCFVEGQGIYLYNVSDERLDGVKEVTAAHEVLHAGYSRLSSRDKARINHLLDQAFQANNDERIKETVETYRKRDPSIVSNELHSILATEARELPSELEEHYRRYFTNRQKVVDFAEQYSSAFTDRERQVEQYEAQLLRLQDEIEADESRLHRQLEELQAERNNLQALLAAERYGEYNAGVPAHNAKAHAYNAAVAQVKAKIARYNDILAERNALALESNELLRALDSRLESIETQ